MTAVDNRRRNSEKRAVWLRNYQRARARALVRLAQQYPDQYKELLEQERLADEKENKTWLDISGRTRAGMGAPTRSRSRRTTKRRGYRKQKGYLGRKK